MGVLFIALILYYLFSPGAPVVPTPQVEQDAARPVTMEAPSTETDLVDTRIVESHPKVETDEARVEDRLEGMKDVTEISIVVLESLKSEEIPMTEKKSILNKALSKISKPEKENLLESIVLSSSDPVILTEALHHLSTVSSGDSLQEFFQRLQIQTFSEEKWRILDEAKAQYLGAD